MRILIASEHRYPASMGGPAGARILDFLAKGLAELGHTVFYYLEQPPALSLPPGITLVAEPRWDVDILHVRDLPVLSRLNVPAGVPWVRTVHTDVAIYDMDRSINTTRCIYVSKTLAATYGDSRHVLNGIDPGELLYSERKRDYLLFVCGLERAMQKGLETAIDIARHAGLPLYFAGSSRDPDLVAHFEMFCRQHGVRYLGEVYGTRKAKLFGRAKAFLFPTRWNEGFGVVMAEALMSGTPVICSSNGACAEVVHRGVGFVCETQADYHHAIDNIGSIKPSDCREWAMKMFHYRAMAQNYLREYEAILCKSEAARA